MQSFVTGGSGFVGRELIRALVAQGHQVRALARSAKSEAAVRAAGAEPVSGDLDSEAALTEGIRGCQWVFHAAAHTEEWDTEEAFYKVNVTGTDNVLAAAKRAGAKRFVLISSESVLADGKPIIRADETRPLPPDPIRGYPSTKGVCEVHVRAANGPELETVIVRPRYIWGRNDTANLVKFVDGLRTGRLKWVSGGRYLTSTCHVANVCEGAILAAEKGRPGEVYFLTDGEPVEFRWFLSEVLKSQGETPPTASVPRWLAWPAAVIGEAIWSTFRLKGTPMATRVAIGLMGQEVTVDDAKARRELGYVGKVSVAEGLAELARLPPVAPAKGATRAAA